LYNYHFIKSNLRYFNNFFKVISFNQFHFCTYFEIIDFSKNWVIHNLVDSKVIHLLNFITSDLTIITNKLGFIDQLNN